MSALFDCLMNSPLSHTPRYVGTTLGTFVTNKNQSPTSKYHRFVIMVRTFAIGVDMSCACRSGAINTPESANNNNVYYTLIHACLRT